MRITMWRRSRGGDNTTANKFRELRSQTGAAFHIAGPGESTPLCGSDNYMYAAGDHSYLDLDTLRSRAERQHAGWHYCGTCYRDAVNM